ncbi:MAG: peptide ABC transporter permease, partial [Zetaproteobacteria bacterium CG02_land_8_20_14_3_00_50_9]
VGLCGLVAVILASLNERRRELAIIRSVGARPADIFVLLTAEGVFITLSGILLGIALLYGISAAMAPLIQGHFGIAITPRPVSLDELWLIAAIIGVSLLASLVPGYGAYRMSLADGLTPRI